MAPSVGKLPLPPEHDNPQNANEPPGKLGGIFADLTFPGKYDRINIIEYKRTVRAVAHRRAFKYFLLRGKRYEESRFYLFAYGNLSPGCRPNDLLDGKPQRDKISERGSEHCALVEAVECQHAGTHAELSFQPDGAFLYGVPKGRRWRRFCAAYARGRNAYGIVYVIVEESLWGQGLGESAVRCAQAQAFLEMRAERMVAKIMPRNRRSIRCVCACGFESAESSGELLRFEMTSAAYFQRLREA